jgi:hypothetical protein
VWGLDHEGTRGDPKACLLRGGVAEFPFLKRG